MPFSGSGFCVEQDTKDGSTVDLLLVIKEELKVAGALLVKLVGMVVVVADTDAVVTGAPGLTGL